MVVGKWEVTSMRSDPKVNQIAELNQAKLVQVLCSSN